MTASGDHPGPLAGEKQAGEMDAGHPEPSAAEVESARLLANDAREPLRAAGLSDERIRVLADEYIAEDIGESVDGFVEWARRRA